MATDVNGIAERYGVILNELSNKERVHINHLVELTGSTKRNLQMDLNQRLKDPFKIETDKKGHYWMDTKYRGLFSASDIKKFSDILGVTNTLPDIDSKFLSEMIESKSNKPFIFKSPYKESIHGNSMFNQIAKAIVKEQKIRFTYNKGDNSKRHNVEPYRLVNNYGTWYLFAVEEGKLKSFRFSKISMFALGIDYFKADKDIISRIENSDTIWLSNTNNITVILSVTKDFVPYFKESITLPGQKEFKDEADGSLTIKLEAYYLEEIKNIIKYWIPRITVVEPPELNSEIIEDIKEYLTFCNQTSRV